MLLHQKLRPKKLKIFILGSPSSGKTSIFNRITNQVFLSSPKEQVGFDIGHRTINIQSKEVKLQVWNTNGQERYFQLIKNFIASSKPHGIIIVYNITDMQSYKQVETWLNITYEVMSSRHVALMLVGNCLDLQSQRLVSKFQPIKDFKFRYELDCVQISAKNGLNCELMISSLVQSTISPHSGILGRLQLKQQEGKQNQQIEGSITSVSQSPKYQDTEWIYGRPRFNEFHQRKRSVQIEMQTIHPTHLIYNPKTDMWERVEMHRDLSIS